MSYSLRQMTPDDVIDVAKIESELGVTSWDIDLFAGEFKMPARQSQWWVTQVDQSLEVVGFGGFTAASLESHVLNLGVAHLHQRIGLGRCLVTKLITEAQSQGCVEMQLEVEASNVPAVSLYESLGFVRVGQRDDYYGKSRHAMLMTKEF